MAYETGTPSSTQDLIQKLSTFITGLSTTPWTEDNLDTTNKRASFHLGNVYVHFKWDGTTQKTIGVFQSLGYVGSGTDQDDHTNDSGNGVDPGVTPVSSGRRVDLEAAGPYSAYHFFAGEGDEPYVYVVVEITTGVYRHFGFGNLVKQGSWTGGEFVHAQYWNPGSGGSDRDNPTSAFHTLLLDGITTDSSIGLAATVHVEGMPNGPASHKWGVCGNISSSAGNDGDGNGRCKLLGSSRSGLWTYPLSFLRTSHLNSYKCLIPVELLYRDASTTPDEWRWLGHMPDVAIVNMANFDAGDEITVGGSETWMVFPWVRKRYTSAGATTDESRNAGIAYKKTA